MESNSIALTKSSAENEIKAYFKKVLELKQTGEEFPVNLELVWPLVYPRKDHAVRDLKDNFIEDIDYQVFPIFGEQDERQWGGNNKVDYHISVSCMEFFIARKVRPVFEVYRKVFHRVAEQQAKPLSTLDFLELAIKGMRENHQELQEVKRDVLELKAKAATRPDYFTIVGYSKLRRIPVSGKQANALGRKASAMCRECSLVVDRVADTLYGDVGAYPASVLDEVFERAGSGLKPAAKLQPA